MLFSLPLLVSLLLACQDGTATLDSELDSELDSDSGQVSGPTWHVLLTADGLLSEENPPVVEVDADMNRVWERDFDGLEGRGAQGIDRDPTGRTVYTRVLGNTSGGWVDLVEPDGTLVWSWEGESAGGLSFPHGVAFTPAGDLVIADTSANRLISVGLDGELLWEEPLPDTSPNGLDLWTDPEGVTHLAVTGRHALRLDLEDQEVLNRYRLRGRTETPELTWSLERPGEDGQLESPHGPSFLEDGSLLYCARTRHQIVAVSAEGEETWRNEVDEGVLLRPQDVAWVEGAMLVADSQLGQLLRIEDPFGAFEVTEAVAMDGIFGVSVVWCGPEDGLPCY